MDTTPRRNVAPSDPSAREAAAGSLAALYRRGVLSTIPALLVSSVFSLLLNRAWTLEPVTERVMMLTPVDLAQQLLLHLGTYARPLALLGGFAVLLALGGAASALAGDFAPRRDRAHSRTRRSAITAVRPAAALAVFLAVLFVVFRPLDPWPTVIFAVLFIVTLAVTRRSTAGTARSSAPGVVMGRASVLSDSARIVGAAAVLTALLLIEPYYKSLTVHRRGGRLFAFRVPAARQSGFSLSGLTPEVTPPSQFYYLTKNLVDPDLSADGWVLRLDGLVARETAYTFDDLLALPAVNQWVTQECVSNPVGGPLISCALFTGVPLRDLIRQSGPRSSAARVVMRAPDGHADSIPIDLALNPDVLVAYGMDGAYLERAHGYPARILIPGSYGFKSIKWVDHLELVDHQFKGTWQELGWTESATVHTTARIDLARRESGGLLVAGVAFAGRRGVRAVQVRAAGGPWLPARLHTPPLSPLTWLQWRLLIPLDAARRGAVVLEARAIDGTGAIQDGRDSDIYPAGATGYHRLTVSV